MSDASQRTATIKAMAGECGFARVGIAPCTPLPNAQGLCNWLARGMQGDMSYMAENLPKRLHPSLLHEGARSAICLAVSCAADGDGLVARFARGRDYHVVLKKRAHALMDRLRDALPGFEGRAFVDTAPVMERSLAVLGGLGWIGRNGCLVCPGLGSHVMLCEILCNQELEYDSPLPSGCDGCGACVRACPTAALGVGDDSAAALVDARRCISYLTIEHRGAVAAELWPQMGVSVFGCDRCQQACPHNGDVPAGDAELTEHLPAADLTLGQVLQWRWEDWDVATRGSTVRRARWEMVLRNALIAAGNSGDPRLLPAVQRLAESHPGLSGLAAWAAERLGSSGSLPDCR